LVVFFIPRLGRCRECDAEEGEEEEEGAGDHLVGVVWEADGLW
jgi:hypothetical protein